MQRHSTASFSGLCLWPVFLKEFLLVFYKTIFYLISDCFSNHSWGFLSFPPCKISHRKFSPKTFLLENFPEILPQKIRPQKFAFIANNKYYTRTIRKLRSLQPFNYAKSDCYFRILVRCVLKKKLKKWIKKWIRTFNLDSNEHFSYRLRPLVLYSSLWEIKQLIRTPPWYFFLPKIKILHTCR